MSNFTEQLPQWDNTGTEPSTQKKTDGWQANEKPPANFFNWLFYRIYKCIEEIRNFVDAHILDYVRQPGYGTTAGSANAYTLTLVSPITAYVEGMCFAIKIHATNTGASTLAVDGLSAITIKKPDGTNTTAGDLTINSIVTVRYNGTNFILQGEGGYKVTAGTFTLYTNNATSFTTNTSPTKLRAATVAIGGTYRVNFAINSPSTTFITYGRIYVNGIAVGTIRSAFNGTLAFSEDIPNIAKNDEIQIYVWKDAGSGSASITAFSLQTNNLVTTVL